MVDPAPHSVPVPRDRRGELGHSHAPTRPIAPNRPIGEAGDARETKRRSVGANDPPMRSDPSRRTAPPRAQVHEGRRRLRRVVVRRRVRWRPPGESAGADPAGMEEWRCQGPPIGIVTRRRPPRTALVTASTGVMATRRGGKATRREGRGWSPRHRTIHQGETRRRSRRRTRSVVTGRPARPQGRGSRAPEDEGAGAARARGQEVRGRRAVGIRARRSDDDGRAIVGRRRCPSAETASEVPPVLRVLPPRRGWELPRAGEGGYVPHGSRLDLGGKVVHPRRGRRGVKECVHGPRGGQVGERLRRPRPRG